MRPTALEEQYDKLQAEVWDAEDEVMYTEEEFEKAKNKLYAAKAALREHEDLMEEAEHGDEDSSD